MWTGVYVSGPCAPTSTRKSAVGEAVNAFTTQCAVVWAEIPGEPLSKTDSGGEWAGAYMSKW